MKNHLFIASFRLRIALLSVLISGLVLGMFIVFLTVLASGPLLPENPTGPASLVWRALLMALPIALLVIAFGAWWLSHRALRAVEKLSTLVGTITAEGLDKRISKADVDIEFYQLITTINEMLDRLEASFKQAVRFSADAAHELKTPLSILQGHLEQGVNESQPGSEEQKRYSMLTKEVQRLKSITKKLLLLSRVDAGELHLNLKPVNLSALIEGAGEDIEVLAPTLTIELDIPKDFWVLADSDLLKQVVNNLTSNAIKYNYHGGTIRLSLHRENPYIKFTISNTGRKISRENRKKIFSRFYRGDKSRNRSHVKGVGLGLSLSREIVRAHNGELKLEPDMRGVVAFSLSLHDAGTPDTSVNPEEK